MKDYLRNLWLWLSGYTRLRELDYKPGWGPWKFLIPYSTTYLAGTLAGYGVASLSWSWYERSMSDKYPFARFMTRLLDWLVPGKHGINAGPRLWDSVCLREMP